MSVIIIITIIITWHGGNRGSERSCTVHNGESHVLCIWVIWLQRPCFSPGHWLVVTALVKEKGSVQGLRCHETVVFNKPYGFETTMRNSVVLSLKTSELDIQKQRAFDSPTSYCRCHFKTELLFDLNIYIYILFAH